MLLKTISFRSKSLSSSWKTRSKDTILTERIRIFQKSKAERMVELRKEIEKITKYYTIIILSPDQGYYVHIYSIQILQITEEKLFGIYITYQSNFDILGPRIKNELQIKFPGKEIHLLLYTPKCDTFKEEYARVNSKIKKHLT
jgi:hypothetical protein